MSLTKLTDLPVECLSQILSLTTPKDVVRTSAVSKLFLSVSESGSIWEKFIPSDYKDFVSQSATSIDEQIIQKKKDLFFYLCKNPIIFNVNQGFSLDYCTGKKIFMLGAGMLNIGRGRINTSWSWNYMPDTRSSENVLPGVTCWLDVIGKFLTKNLSPNTTYGVYLVYKEHVLVDNSYDCVYTQVEAIVIEVDYEKPLVNGNEVPINRFTLKVPPYNGAVMEPEECPIERNDGWLEVEMGRFHVGDNASYNEKQVLKMWIKQIREYEDLFWMSEITICGIEIRPVI